MQNMPPPTLPSIAPKPRNNKLLAIVLVVSTIFFMAAIAVCVWLLTTPATSNVVQQPTGDGSDKVKKVSFVAPAEMPAQYARRDQNVGQVVTTYYLDAAASCSISTNVEPVSKTASKIKDAVIDATKAAQAQGITTTANTDSGDYKIKDAERTYTFPSLQLEQAVEVAGVPYKAQRTIIAYKQFGALVASISYSCKTDSWEAKKAELRALVETFTIKTEK